MTTFSHEANLPALPLPQCASLRTILPELLTPLVGAATLHRSVQSLEQFLATDGPILEQALKEWQKQQPGNGSWLNALWEKDYLSFRQPLPVNMNYFVLLDALWGFTLGGLLSSLAGVIQDLARQNLPPEMVRDSALSMHQCRSMFYTRLPLPGCDSLHHVPVGGLLTAAVVCNGFWYILPLTDAAGHPFEAQKLEAALEAIQTTAESTPPPPSSLGAITTAPREEAAALRALLEQKECNRLSLAALENSAIVLCLDDDAEEENDSTSHCRNALCGPAANRWYDKSMQVIKPPHGPLGINFEHAGCDASAWCHVLSIATKNMQHPPDSPAVGQPQPRSLVWELSDTVQKELRRMEADYGKRVQGLDLCCTDPDTRFGKEALKALKCSPDAFVQASLQHAQLEVFGTFVSCYEAFSMRHYAQGRTECARPSTLQAKTLAQAIRENLPAEVLRGLFSAAAEEHGRRLTLCRKGEAMERLVYGLKNMYALFGKELGITEQPPFFTDPGLLALGRSRLSTSGLGVPFITHFGFGPVEQDGLGTGYMMRSGAVSLVVTGFKGTSPKPCDFAKAFVRSASIVAAALKGSG